MRKFIKTPITHQRETQKLELCASLALGICILSNSALALAISVVKVENPGKVDFSHSFLWQESTFSKKPIESQVHVHPRPPLSLATTRLPVSPNLKGKVMVWGTPNHLKWDFGAKSGKKRFLTQKYKNNKFSRFL